MDEHVTVRGDPLEMPLAPYYKDGDQNKILKQVRAKSPQNKRKENISAM